MAYHYKPYSSIKFIEVFLIRIKDIETCSCIMLQSYKSNLLKTNLERTYQSMNVKSESNNLFLFDIEFIHLLCNLKHTNAQTHIAFKELISNEGKTVTTG